MVRHAIDAIDDARMAIGFRGKLEIQKKSVVR